MEDLSIDDLIADVVANPAPQRVPCAPPMDEPITAQPPSLYRRLRRRIRTIVRRGRSDPR